MATEQFPSGLGSVTGPSVLTGAPAMATGNVWFVGPGGVDAASVGKQRIRPLLTLAQAHTNAAAGDTIVLLSGHTQSLTAGQTFNKAGITLASEGLGSSRAQFTATGAAFVLFTVSAADVRIINCVFNASTGTPTSRLVLTAAGFRMQDCSWSIGVNDTLNVDLQAGGDRATFRDTTFTLVASGGNLAMKATAAVAGLTLDNVTFDGGSIGWPQSAGFAFDSAAAVTNLYGPKVNLLNGSPMNLFTGSTGIVVLGNESGSSTITGL